MARPQVTKLTPSQRALFSQLMREGRDQIDVSYADMAKFELGKRAASTAIKKRARQLRSYVESGGRRHSKTHRPIMVSVSKAAEFFHLLVETKNSEGVSLGDGYLRSSPWLQSIERQRLRDPGGIPWYSYTGKPADVNAIIDPGDYEALARALATEIVASLVKRPDDRQKARWLKTERSIARGLVRYISNSAPSWALGGWVNEKVRFMSWCHRHRLKHPEHSPLDPPYSTLRLAELGWEDDQVKPR